MIGSLADLVMMPGMPSEPTLRKMIAEREDFPILSRGKNGHAYEFDLAVTAQFVHDLRRRDEEIARERAVQVKQLGLSFLGGEAMADPGQIGLSPAERRALLEEELVAIKLAERRGELIRKSRVEEAVGAMLVMFQQRGASFSARLSKRADFTREQMAAIDTLMAQDQAELADKLEQMGTVSGDASSSDTDPAVRNGI